MPDESASWLELNSLSDPKCVELREISDANKECKRSARKYDWIFYDIVREFAKSEIRGLLLCVAISRVCHRKATQERVQKSSKSLHEKGIVVHGAVRHDCIAYKRLATVMGACSLQW